MALIGIKNWKKAFFYLTSLICFLFIFSFLLISTQIKCEYNYSTQYKESEKLYFSTSNKLGLIDTFKKNIDSERDKNSKLQLIENLCYLYDTKLTDDLVQKNNIKEVDKIDYEKYLTLAIENSSSSPIIYFLRGNLYYDNGDFEKANISFKKAIDLNYFDVWKEVENGLIAFSYYQLATSFEKGNDIKNAEIYWNRFLFVTQTSLSSYISLAMFNFSKKNDVDKAIEYINIGLAMSGGHSSKDDYINAFYLLGIFYTKKDLKAEAIKAFERILEIDSTNEKAKDRLKKLKV